MRLAFVFYAALLLLRKPICLFFSSETMAFLPSKVL